MITPDEIRAVVEQPSKLGPGRDADDQPILCIGCHQPLTAENWPLYRQKNRHRICRVCQRVRAQEWRRNNPEKATAQQRSWYWSHLEQSRSAGRRHANEWRKSHPEEIKAALKTYRESHRESVRASIKAWEKANPDKNRAIRRRASARYSFLKRSNGTYEPIKPEEIFERDHWRCKACKAEAPRELQGTLEDNAPTLDHIVPVSLGGPHTRRNLRCLCRKCNRAKYSKYQGQLAFA